MYLYNLNSNVVTTFFQNYATIKNIDSSQVLIFLKSD
nr:MAG TPA: hypothetical protein [Bacteriophage sp.]